MLAPYPLVTVTRSRYLHGVQRSSTLCHGVMVGRIKTLVEVQAEGGIWTSMCHPGPDIASAVVQSCESALW